MIYARHVRTLTDLLNRVKSMSCRAIRARTGNRYCPSIDSIVFIGLLLNCLWVAPNSGRVEATQDGLEVPHVQTNVI